MPDGHVAAGLPTCDAHQTVMQVKNLHLREAQHTGR